MTQASSQQTGPDVATDYALFRFIVQSMLSRMATATLVRVESCTNSGGLSPWGTVDVQPLVSQLSGANVAVPHGKLFSLPYVRLQGGVSAVIIDPQPGDIGLAVFSARDISSLKSQEAIDQVKAGSIPGVSPASGRQYNMADGIYIGGMLNAQPTQFVRFSGDGIHVVSPTKITLDAPEIDLTASSKIVINSPANDIKGGATKIDDKPFLPHTHSGVTPGSGSSGGVT